MKILVRTLLHDTFEVEIDETETVKNLKQKIHEVKGDEFPASWLKLIYAGKILKDDTKIKDCEYKDTRYIVVMIIKPKTETVEGDPQTGESSTVKQTDDNSAETGKADSSAMDKDKPAPNEGDDKDAGQSTNVPVPDNAAPSSERPWEAAGLSSEQYNEMVQFLVELGYGFPAVEVALQASFFNPDRAAEYLLNGAPIGADDGTEASTATEEPISEGPVSEDEDRYRNTLDFLREQPFFQQMRQTVRSDPSLLGPMFQQMERLNPELLQVISENQQVFLRMLNEPDEEGSETTAADERSQPAPNVPSSISREMAASGATAPAPVVAGERSISQEPWIANLDFPNAATQLTQQDKEAINRLKDMGYPEYLVVQAYLACDKDENMAADFLISQGD